MPTKRSCLSKIVLLPLFVFSVSVLVEESNQHILRSSSVESPCLRRCVLLRAVKRSKIKVSTFSCYRSCIKNNNPDQEAKQRSRKALKPVPECGSSSPYQSVDWTPSVVNVTFGQYENTSYWYVNVSWTPFNESYGNWTDIMVRFVVFTSKSDPSAPMPTTCSVHPKNLTFLNINISSHHYEYPNSILLKVVALPYSPNEDFADITAYKPPTQVKPIETFWVGQSATKLTQEIQSTTGVFPTTTARKSSCSRKEYGDLIWYPPNVHGRFLKRSNGDWFANISWTPLTNSTDSTWTGYFLVFLFGDVSKIPICVTVPKNQTFYVVDSSLGWKAPQSISVLVSAYPFPKRTVTPKMHNFNFPVHDTPTTPPEKLLDTTTPPSPGNSILIVIVFSSVSGGFVLLLITLLLVRRWWRKKPRSSLWSSMPMPTPARFKYHAFIIYSSKDHDFVKNILIPVLERYSFKYCIHWKDFPVGEVFTRTIVRSVYNSFKVIAVVSKNFATGKVTKFELDQAQHRLLTKGDDCLFVIKYDDVDVTKVLGAPLLERSYIDYTMDCDRRWLESKLVQVLRNGVLEDESDDCSEGNADNNNLI